MSSSVPPEMQRRVLRFRELPDRLKSKIEKARGRETAACWLWTAACRQARSRFRVYPPSADPDGFRKSNGRFGWESPTPQVYDPFSKKKVDAHRAVYAELTCVSIADVPKLSRCPNPMCVSPHHNTPVGPTAAQRNRSVTNAALVAEAQSPQSIDVMAILKRTRPADFSVDFSETDLSKLDFSLAEEEGQLPPGSLTLEIWLEYLKFDAENPID